MFKKIYLITKILAFLALLYLQAWDMEMHVRFTSAMIFSLLNHPILSRSNVLIMQLMWLVT